MVSEEEVRKIIQLSYLNVEEGRIAALTKEFNSILNYIEKLKEVDVTGVETMSHVHGFNNIFREDQIKPGLSTEDALKNAPDRSGDFIRVPLIIDQGSDN